MLTYYVTYVMSTISHDICHDVARVAKRAGCIVVVYSGHRL